MFFFILFLNICKKLGDIVNYSYKSNGGIVYLDCECIYGSLYSFELKY